MSKLRYYKELHPYEQCAHERLIIWNRES